MGSRWKLLKARTADRGKWPRKWWRPLPEELDLSPDEWKKQHDEISKAINKLLLILIGFCFFCGLALGAPDSSLLASNAKIALPFANTEISFTSFLIIAPLVLAGLSFYLHIFIGYWTGLSRQQSVHLTPEQVPQALLPFVFNLPYRTAKWLSGFLFYWLVPLILAVFAWKDLPRPEASILYTLALIFIAMFLFLHMRRDIHQRDRFSSFVHWTMLLVLLALMIGVFFGVQPHRSLTLFKADLKEQDLTAINLNGAYLTRAKLSDADLSKVRNLTQQQVNVAFGNQKTTLPAGIIQPKQWLISQ